MGHPEIVTLSSEVTFLLAAAEAADVVAVAAVINAQFNTLRPLVMPETLIL